MTAQQKVSPDQRGVTWNAWICAEAHRMCEEYLRTVTKADRENAPINHKAIATPRDSYGWRSAGDRHYRAAGEIR